MKLVQMSIGTDEIGTDELWLIQGLVKMRYAGVEVAPFHMAWSLYAEGFRSQFEETYWEVDEVRLNYMLNYELLSSILLDIILVVVETAMVLGVDI